MNAACGRCGSELGCVECSPEMMRLSIQVKKLQRELEETRKAGSPSGQDQSEGDPAEHLEVDELRAEVERLREKDTNLKQQARKLKEQIRPAYVEVLRAREAVKKGWVFSLGVDLEKFLDDIFAC